MSSGQALLVVLKIVVLYFSSSWVEVDDVAVLQHKNRVCSRRSIATGWNIWSVIIVEVIIVFGSGLVMYVDGCQYFGGLVAVNV